MEIESKSISVHMTSAVALAAGLRLAPRFRGLGFAKLYCHFLRR